MVGSPRPAVEPGHKWCIRCETAKPLEDFTRKTDAKDGKYPWCRPCYNANAKTKYHRFDDTPKEAKVTPMATKADFLEVIQDAEKHRALTTWERGFIENLSGRSDDYTLSDKQVGTLKQIETKIYQTG